MSERHTISDRHGCLTANFRDHTLSGLLEPNASEIHLPTLFVLDLASKGIFLCMNEYSILQVIAQDFREYSRNKESEKGENDR